MRNITDVVTDIMHQPRVIYFPIKHFSPVCAYHLQRLIRTRKPIGVLVEGPQDATELIPHIVDSGTHPPITIFSTYVDKKNQFELNGILSPSKDIPARYRGWWPLTRYTPEYVALKTGFEVGAELAFIDIPLHTTIPYHHAPQQTDAQLINDRHLATSQYFQALQQKQRRRSFDEFWNANFEIGGYPLATEQFMRMILTFAYCTRLSGQNNEAALHADGTLLREQHMRFMLDNFLKQHPEGDVIVVTGAFHSVALPFTKKRKARIRIDKNLETHLTNHSYPALARLYQLNRLPYYADVVWQHIQTKPADPFNQAALQLLLEIMRTARDDKQIVCTADSINAYQVARNLAILRNNQAITTEDLLDAVNMGYIKGDLRIQGSAIDKICQTVLIGNQRGRVTPNAGQIALLKDYYQSTKQFRIDTSGQEKIIRCDLFKQQAHRLKSAFLHQCHYLEIPMFGKLDNDQTHYKGPNFSTGENMHLIAETWAIRWREIVDDRLIALNDRGTSITQVAAITLQAQQETAHSNVQLATHLLLQSAHMMLLELFDRCLDQVETAIRIDNNFSHLVQALNDFVMLYSHRDNLATQGYQRILNTIVTLYNRANSVLPILARANAEDTPKLLDQLLTLLRITMTFEAVTLDRQLFIERLLDLSHDLNGSPTIRGATFGILFSLGATREKVIATELKSYLYGSPDRLLQSGCFLDGLFMSGKAIFTHSPRLMRAINELLKTLDWETFKVILPDLRRAFTQFIPTEIDHISHKISEEIGLIDARSDDQPIPDLLAAHCAHTDQRITTLLKNWL